MRVVLVMVLCSILVAGSATADSIELVSGDVLAGEIVEIREDVIVLENPTLGRVEIPRADIAPPKPEDPPNPGLFGTSFLEGFDRTFGFGVAGSQGRTNGVTINLRLNVDKEDEAARRMFRSRYFYSTSDNGLGTPTLTQANEFVMEYGHDFLFEDSKWFLFGRGRYDFDSIEVDWDNRVGGTGGVGYDILRNDNWEVLGRVGVGVTYQWGGINTLTRPEGQLGLDAKWNISDNDNLTLTNNYFPDFQNTPDFRFVTVFAWNVALDYLDGLGFTTGVENEYDSSRTTAKNNLKYFLNLTYDF